MISLFWSAKSVRGLFLAALTFMLLASMFTSVAEAKTIKRGIQTSPLEIGWNIVGGSGTCDGGFVGVAYPNAPDSIQTKWTASHYQSASPLLLVPAGGVVYFPGTYTFGCTDSSSGKSDTDILVINDCTAAEYWNGTNCVPKVPPTVTTNPADAISPSQATLNATVNPNGSPTSVTYRYGTTNGTCASLPSTAGVGSVGGGTSGVPVQATISSLTPNTTYYFCATASNGYGATNGNVLSFATLAANAPTVSNSDVDTSVTIGAGGSVNRTSTANDANGNLIQHELAWSNPNGTNSWDSGAPYSLGATTGSGPQFTFAPKATDARTVTFTPAMIGVYNTWWKASDNTGLSVYSSGKTVTVRCPDGTYYDGSGFSSSDCITASNATGPGGYPGNPYGGLTCTYGGIPPLCGTGAQLPRPDVSLTPVNVNCSISNGGKSEIQWSDSPGAQVYRIEQTNTVTNVIVEYTQSASEQRKFTTPDNTLVDGTIYSYRVRAEAVGYTASEWSVPKNLRACAPATPLNLTAIGSCPVAGVKLDWVPGTYGPDPEWRGFKVYRGGVLIANNYGSQSASTYTDLTGNTGVPYQYKVIAQSKHDSFESNQVEGIAPFCGAMTNVTSDPAALGMNGSAISGQTVTFSGRVVNTGSLTINTPFTDNFTYCWNAGCTNWMQFGPHISESVPLNAGSNNNDTSVSFLLAGSGTLRIQHCVDSSGNISMEDENDNCSVRDFTIVGSTPVNGACGPAAFPSPKAYSFSATGFAGPLCGPGTPSPANPVFPSAASSINWTCLGVSGGSPSPQCTATRAGGTISVTTCQIPVGQSSCDVRFKWDSKYTLNPNPEVYFNSTNIMSGQSNSNFPYTATRGTNQPYMLKDGNDTLAWGTLDVDCEAGSAWSGSVCVSTAVPPTLSVTKGGVPVTIVNVNDTVKVEWDTNNTAEASCSLKGGGLNYDSLPTNTGDAETGWVNVIVDGRKTFTLTCSAGTVVKTIDIRPQGWES